MSDSLLFAMLWIGAAFATGAALYGPPQWCFAAMEAGLCAFAATIICFVDGE